MKKIYFLFFVGWVLSLGRPALAAPSVQAVIAPAKALRGDVVTLNVQVTGPSGSVVDPPVLPATVGNFEIRASSPLPSQSSNGQTTARFEIELQDFTTGQETLPAFKMIYHDLNGVQQSVDTPAASVLIEDVPAGPNDKGDIRGIKGIIGPIAASPWWWLILLVAIVALGAYAWSRRQRKIFGPPPPPPVPADQAALEALIKLRGTGWLESGKLKEFYSGLSDVVRTYLEDGFKIHALERTTNELMRDLRKRSEVASESLVELQTLLENCDLVKFAKFRPEAAEGLNDHALAVRLVEKTRASLPGRVESKS